MAPPTQEIELQPHFGHNRFVCWVIGSAAGTTLVAVAIFLFLEFEDLPKDRALAMVAILAAFIATGAYAGLTQWLVLGKVVGGPVRWSVATAVGVVAGIIAIDVVANLSAGIFEMESAIGQTVSSALAGLALGSIQWIVRRRRVRSAGWWILASGGGVMLLNLTFIFLNRGVDFMTASIARYAFTGAAVGGAYGVITGAVLFRLLKTE